jgi:hypothetical protein
MCSISGVPWNSQNSGVEKMWLANLIVLILLAKVVVGLFRWLSNGLVTQLFALKETINRISKQEDV